MAVGLVISGNRYPRRGQSKRGPSFRIRRLSNIGLYPRGNIRGTRGIPEGPTRASKRISEDQGVGHWLTYSVTSDPRTPVTITRWSGMPFLRKRQPIECHEI